MDFLASSTRATGDVFGTELFVKTRLECCNFRGSVSRGSGLVGVERVGGGVPIGFVLVTYPKGYELLNDLSALENGE